MERMTRAHRNELHAILAEKMQEALDELPERLSNVVSWIPEDFANNMATAAFAVMENNIKLNQYYHDEDMVKNP